jgi:hypothetical protein
MKFQEIISRLTGFSTPIFGVQWTPPESQRAAARRVVVFLEDRRVLFVPSEMESPEHCVQSILRIREFLTHELSGIDSDQPLAQSLRAMRAACRKCLATVEADDRRFIQFGAHRDHYASWIFNGRHRRTSRCFWGFTSLPLLLRTVLMWKAISPRSFPQP